MHRKLKIMICVLVCCITAAGCGDNHGKVVVKSEYAPLSSSLVTAQVGEDFTDPKEQDIISKMEILLENSDATLYLGEYFDVAVLDKKSGKVFFSNRQIYNENSDFSDQEKHNAYSQVFIDYLDNGGRIFKLTSFPECFDGTEKQQVEVVKSDDFATLTYTFGNQADSKLICTAFTLEGLNEVVEKGEGLRESGKLSRSEWGRFTSSYNHIVLEELSEQARKEALEKYPKLEELGELYVLSPSVTHIQLELIEKVGKLIGVDQQLVDTQKELTGGAGEIEQTTPSFSLEVKYVLQQSDLIVSVDLDSVNEPKNQFIHKIYVIPSFGATTTQDDGYIFLPDGSGAIVDSSAIPSGVDNLEINFYGTDFSGNITSSDDVTPTALFPVFGIKNNDTAIFATVESMDGQSGVTAQVSGANNPENIAMPWIKWRDYYQVETDDTLSGLSNFMIAKKAPSGTWAIRYHFLYEDNATYSGMARYYRQVLEQNEIFTNAKISDEIVLDIELLGSIQKKQFKFGIPMTAPLGLSTFDEAAELSNWFYKQNIEHLDMTFLGVFNGGLEFKSFSKVKIEKVLGGENGLKNLKSTLDENGYNLSTQMEFTHIYKTGNGIKSSRDLIRKISKKYAMYSGFHPSSGLLNDETKAYLVNPLSFESMITSFIDKNKDSHGRGIYMDISSNLLNSNYTENYQLTRQESEILTKEALLKLVDNGYEIKMKSPNAYALPYANSVSGLPTSSSGHRLITRSVPFAGMVLHGNISYSSGAINKAENMAMAKLQSLESGAGLKYQLMTGEIERLSKTKFTEFYMVSSEELKEDIVETVNEWSEFYKSVAKSYIYSHEMIFENVVCVKYSNGASVIINYNDYEVKLNDGISIDAMRYKFFEEGEGYEK